MFLTIFVMNHIAYLFGTALGWGFSALIYWAFRPPNEESVNLVSIKINDIAIYIKKKRSRKKEIEILWENIIEIEERTVLTGYEPTTKTAIKITYIDTTKTTKTGKFRKKTAYLDYHRRTMKVLKQYAKTYNIKINKKFDF